MKGLDMTLGDMKSISLAAAVCVAVAVSASGVHAQTGTAAAAAVRALPPPPTGAVSALTKAGALVRQSRAAALAGKGAAGTAANGLGKSTQIMGYLWSSNNGAITDASVQIRNTVTNTVEAITKTNSAGEFLFQNVDAGEYVIEYVSDSAKRLVAIGHPFTVSPGETVATFVRLSNGLPMLLPNELSNLAGNTATQAVASAASEGVTAFVNPIAATVSPVVPPTVGGNPPPPTSPPPVASAIK
jgi:hypothetical protein